MECVFLCLHPIPPPPPPLSSSSVLELPSIAVTYRQSLESNTPTEVPSVSVRDRDNPLHTFNRTLKTFLTPRRRSRSPKSKGLPGQEIGGGGGGGGSKGQEQNGSFHSYIKEVEEEEKGKASGEGGGGRGGERGSLSGGSSPLCRSPGGEQRRPGAERYPRGKRREGEEEEEEDRLYSRHSYMKRERGGMGMGASESNTFTELGNLGGGSSSSNLVSTKGSSGRSDSLGRGLKPFNHSQLRRCPSNESMSSQSTLVPKTGYEHDDTIGIADILRNTAPSHGLTQSNIRDHVKQEARKHNHGRHYLRHNHHRREEEEEEEDEDYEYEKGRGYGVNRRRNHSGSGGVSHDGGRRGMRKGLSGRRDRAGVKEVDQG